MAPKVEETPTTKREYAVAVTGLTANKYTKIGTDRIEPPPPISPKTIPIKRAPKYPKICVISMTAKLNINY